MTRIYPIFSKTKACSFTSPPVLFSTPRDPRVAQLDTLDRLVRAEVPLPTVKAVQREVRTGRAAGVCCLEGCGKPVAPGRRPNGAPKVACCRAHRRLAKEQQAPGAELRADAEDVAEDLLAGGKLANQSSGMELGCQMRGVRESSNARLEQYNARFIEGKHGHNLFFVN